MKAIRFIAAMVFMLGLCGRSSAQLACLGELNVDLGTQCQIILSPTEIGLNLDPAYVYTLSRNTFGCEDVGRSYTVTLEQRDRSTRRIINTCWSTVNIHSRSVPSPCERPLLYCRSEVTVNLNAEGFVVLTPDMISLLPTDGNPYQVYSVEPGVLDCGNLGSNSVRLVVRSACFPEDYCTVNVNVRDEGSFRPTCYYVDADGMEFFPANLDQIILPPGSPVSYRMLIRRPNQNSFPPPAQFRMYLSRDKVPDGKDLLVSQQMVQFNKTGYMTGKFSLPQNLQAGVYYLIGDMYSINKKFRYAMPTIVQRIQVGKGGKINELESRSEEAPVADQDVLIYPNPFEDQIFIDAGDASAQISRMELFNLCGVKLMSLNAVQSPLDVSQLSNGSYLLKIEFVDGHAVTRKVVKQSAY